jgi:transcriptional regulator with XRE-family HTH domain
MRVRYWRKYYYKSLPEAAKLASIPKSTWSKIENGKSNFTYKTLRKLCKALFKQSEDLL